MNGKRGEKPPLPRNCKRRRNLREATARQGGKVQIEWQRVASQETGPAQHTSRVRSSEGEGGRGEVVASVRDPIHSAAGLFISVFVESRVGESIGDPARRSARS